MSAFQWAAVVYLPWFFYWVVMELLAYFVGPAGVLRPGIVPFYTLSEFVWADEQICPPLLFVFLLGFPLLGLHFAHASVKKIISVFK